MTPDAHRPVFASGRDGPISERLAGMARFTLAGAILGGLAFWSADTASRGRPPISDQNPAAASDGRGGFLP